MSNSPANWYADPFRHYQFRYWDGNQWTNQVANNGVLITDEESLASSPPPVLVESARPTYIGLIGIIIVILSAIALLICSFFPWLGFNVNIRGLGNFSDSASAWGFLLLLSAVIIGTSTIIPSVIRLSGVRVPAYISLALGSTALMLILAKFIFGVGGLPSGFETTREAGIFLGLIFSAGIVGGSATLLVQDLTIPRD